jgi:SAM-dependent methyltransferase
MTTVQEVFSAALRGEPCTISGLGRRPVDLPVHHWSGVASGSDDVVLGQCRGVTLDVGCGPGRLTTALAELGVPSLGIDIVPEAIRQARARGACALVRDVFSRVPGDGHWDSVLLADGNIGIAGDPLALLRRVAKIVHARGRVVVDLAPPGAGLTTRRLRLHTAGDTSDRFMWSEVGPEAIQSLAEGAGLDVVLLDEQDGRWFAVLGKASHS